MFNEDSVRQALQTVKYPGYNRDIVSFGLVKEIKIAAGAVNVVVHITGGSASVASQIKSDCERAIAALNGAGPVLVEVVQHGAAPGTPGGGTAQNPWGGQQRVSGIKKIIAVASGKGGVGKSTLSVNLACGLQLLGKKVGLLDCDIYGPSIPLMMGTTERPTVTDDNKMIPPVRHGVHLMSIGFLIDGDQPVIWRGPMIMKTIQQFFNSVEWGTLDYLLVDLPPGTGDAQLSLCQTVPLDGGVIITTPQEASLGVVRKGIAMFRKVNVPILGIVENMSYFTSPQGERIEIFGHGGGSAEAKRQSVPFLGEVPLFQAIREGGDAGYPAVLNGAEDIAGKSLMQIARALDQANA
jgi:ATP-binding protein involved in chromosome partitioning